MNATATNCISITQSAGQVFDAGLVSGLQKSSAGVMLDDRVLVEDDSPGAGVRQLDDGTPVQSYDELSGEVHIRKIVHIDDPRALAAVLTFYGTEPSGPDKAPCDLPLCVLVNGRRTEVGSLRARLPGRYKRKARPCRTERDRSYVIGADRGNGN